MAANGWARKTGVLTRYTSRSVVLSTASTTQPCCLTGIAMQLWLRLADEHDTDRLVDSVIELTGVPREAAAAAALDTLHHLADLGAVVAQ